jgi:hypothetical protein
MLISRARWQIKAIIGMWLDVHPAVLVFALGGLASVLIAAFAISLGTEQVSGIVDREYTEVGRGGLIYHGLVRVRGLPVYANVLTPPNCVQGDSISLLRVSHIWGSSYSVPVRGCHR